MKFWKRTMAIIICLSLIATFPIFPAAKAESASDCKIYDLMTNDLVNPIGLDDPTPNFSWKMQSEVVGQKQTAYQIKVYKEGTVVWDSGKVLSDISVGITYRGTPLTSSTRYNWNVTVWDKDGNIATSKDAYFEIAFLENDAFSDTSFITYDVSHYTIDFDFIVDNKALGFLFNAKDEHNYIMWQINAGTGKLAPHVKNTSWWVSYPTAGNISSALGGTGSAVYGQLYHARMQVEGKTVKTWLGKSVDSLSLVHTYTFSKDVPLNRMGFRQATNEIARVDNFVVKDQAGRIIFENDFSEETDLESFPGGSSQLSNGMLKVGNSVSETVMIQARDNESVAAFRKAVSVKPALVSAKLYTAGLGVYENYINGQRVGNLAEDGSILYDELKPGFTQRNVRQFYNTYDVTWMLKEGQENVLSSIVTDGWWRGVGVLNQGAHTSYLAKLILTYEDGTKEVVKTDSTWKAANQAPLVYGTGIYEGERYDATVDLSWMLPGFDDSSWENVSINTEFKGTLDAWYGSPVIVRDDLERKPVGMTVYQGATNANASQYGKINTIATYSDGDQITVQPGQTLLVNFGQNFAGWEYIEVEGTRGTNIHIEHGEWLNDNNGLISRGNDGPEGSIYNANYRTAFASTEYKMSGNGIEKYHPSFSFYGFQYIEITADQPITVHKVRGQVVSSVNYDTSTMETSNADVNQLISNITWGMYSNYLSIPTDCPQRQERHGWAGDSQVFSQAGTYLTYSKSFLMKYHQDMRDAQRSDGAYSDIAPYVNNYGTAINGNATYEEVGWGDAGIIIPWYLYMMYGDTSVITEAWDSMRKYMDVFMESTNGNGPVNGPGDHLALESANKTNIVKLLGVVYYAWDALLMADMAEAIGQTDVAAHYRSVYQREKAIFQERYVADDGSLVYREQTALLYALYLDLLPNQQSVNAVTEQLISNIKGNGNKMMTGFLGTSIINKALTKAGKTSLAYQLLLQEGYPSWLYSVKQGATTIWERWNTYTKETGFGDVTMNSFNHYSYGAVYAWMMQTMAGIGFDPETPGFKNIIISPEYDASLPYVKASYNSVYGPIEAESTLGSDVWKYNITIPANTTATIRLPAGDLSKLTVNELPVNSLNLDSAGIKYDGIVDGKIVLQAVSGTFKFSYAFNSSGNEMDLNTACAHCNSVPTWKAFDGTFEEEGHYYLSDSIAVETAVNVPAGSYCIHLNGNTISNKQFGSIFQVQDGASLQVMDVSENYGAVKVFNSANVAGRAVYVQSGGSLSVYSGTILMDNDASGANGSLVYLEDGSCFTMNGGIISDGNTSANGGNIYAEEGAEITINGGQIINGSAAKGGNIYTEADITIHGGSILYGTATTSGGNIYCKNSVFSVDEDVSSTAINTACAPQGGNITLDGSQLTIDAGMIAYGTATGTTSSNGGGNVHINSTSTLTVNQDSGKKTIINCGKTSSSYYGGNIQNLGTLIINAGTIDRGYSSSTGSNIYNAKNMTVTGGFIGKAYLGNSILITGTGNTTINGGTLDGNYFSGNQKSTKGANIHIWDNGKLTVNGGTLLGGKTSAEGGNILAEKGATITINGGSITGSLNSDIALTLIAEVAGATNNPSKAPALSVKNATVGYIYVTDDNNTYDPSVSFSGVTVVNNIVRGGSQKPILKFEGLEDGSAIHISGGTEGEIFGTGDSAAYITGDSNLIPKLDGTNLVWSIPAHRTVTVISDNPDAFVHVQANDAPAQSVKSAIMLFEGTSYTLKALAANDVDYKIVAWKDANGNVIGQGDELRIDNITEDMTFYVETKYIGVENIALGATVISPNATQNSQWKTSGLTDGKYNSDTIVRGFCSAPFSGSTQSISFEIDLGADKAFNKIHLYPRTDKFASDGTTSSFPKAFEVQVCMNGSSEYETVATYSSTDAPYLKPAVIKFADTTARYIRVIVTQKGAQNAGESGNYIQLAEMGVYNAPKPPMAVHEYSGDCDEFCNLCGEARTPTAEHSYDENDVCTVCNKNGVVYGDLNSDGNVNVRDVETLLMHTLYPKDFPVPVNCDFTLDGEITIKDVEYLLMHTLYPQYYPLKQTQ